MELQATRRRPIALNREHVLLRAGPGGQSRRVAVVLEETAYEGKLLQLEEGRASERTIAALCYELRSSETAVPYSWCVWSVSAMGRFRLVTSEGPRSYLAWVLRSSVFFAEVSSPRDRCVALADYYTARPIPELVRVPARALVPQVREWGVNALYCDIVVRSIDKDDEGNWVVNISPPDSEEVITLVGKDGDWRRE
jgi:hypothetical protein